MVRNIIRIDEERCDGCGLCAGGCPEGALRVIDGKARLVGDLLCDGLGACIGTCPREAIAVESREAEAYDEQKVLEESILPKGDATVLAHLEHLRNHGEDGYLSIALAVLAERGHPIPEGFGGPTGAGNDGGAAGSGFRAAAPGPIGNVDALRGLRPAASGPEAKESAGGTTSAPGTGHRADGGPSALRQWPVQLHLINPRAPVFGGADLLLAADCAAFAAGDFHRRWLDGKALAIGCPKLDEGVERYIEKIRIMIDESRVDTITVLRMQVPCCGGLVRIAREAAARASRKVPIKSATLDASGNLLEEVWL